MKAAAEAWGLGPTFSSKVSRQKPAIKQLSLADVRAAENSIEKLAKQNYKLGLS
jgi:hypothetical protein